MCDWFQNLKDLPGETTVWHAIFFRRGKFLSHIRANVPGSSRNVPSSHSALMSRLASTKSSLILSIRTLAWELCRPTWLSIFKFSLIFSNVLLWTFVCSRLVGLKIRRSAIFRSRGRWIVLVWTKRGFSGCLLATNILPPQSSAFCPFPPLCFQPASNWMPHCWGGG